MTVGELEFRQAFLQPEAFVFKIDVNRFENYLENWKKEDNIQELWFHGPNDYFPFDHEAFGLTEILNCCEYKQIADLFDNLKAPCLIYELFAGFVYINHGDNILLELLKVAPLTNNEIEKMKWNHSFVAPILLHSLVSKRLQRKVALNNVPNHDEAMRFFESVVDVLCVRDDGYFLTWNYLQFLIRDRNHDQVLADRCIECMGKAYAGRVNEYLYESSLKELFQIDIKSIEKNFCETAILNAKKDHSLCFDVLTYFQFLSEEADKEKIRNLLPFFEVSLMFKDQSLPSYEAQPFPCHYYAAGIYMAFDTNAIAAIWKATWNKFAAAQRYIQFNYYNDMSSDLKNNTKFLLLVGSALLHYLYVEKNYEEMRILWQTLWSVILETLQNKAGASAEFNLNYAKVLAVWKAKLDLAIDSDQILEDVIQHLKSITTYPRLLLQSIACLQANHCLNKTELLPEQRDTLKASVNKALRYFVDNNGEIYVQELGKQCLKSL